VETSTEPTLATSSVRAGVKRHRCEATRWWHVHPTVGTHADERLKTVPRARFLSSCWVAHRPMSSVARSMRHGRGKGENEWALGFARGRRRGFVRPNFTCGRWMQMDGSRLPDRVAAQVGNDFPGLGPRRGLASGPTGHFRFRADFEL
jgi:hypothetical protein